MVCSVMCMVCGVCRVVCGVYYAVMVVVWFVVCGACGCGRRVVRCGVVVCVRRGV